jgi:hypothetical protein
MITGNFGWAALRRLCSSSPLIPGSRRSRIKQSQRRVEGASKNSSADENPSASKPTALSKRLTAHRTSRSSSTIVIRRSTQAVLQKLGYVLALQVPIGLWSRMRWTMSDPSDHGSSDWASRIGVSVFNRLHLGGPFHPSLACEIGSKRFRSLI